MKIRISLLSVLVTLSTLNAPFSTAFAQGTAFTYQGRLNDGASPANGSYDLQFAIYDSTNNPGTLIAGPVTNSAVLVNNGLFTVIIDFGPGALTGRATWLELGVRTNGSGAFATLSPRQQLTPAPYAVIAENLAEAGTNNVVQAGSTAALIVGGQNNLIRSSSIDAAIVGGEHNSIGTNSGAATINGGLQNGIQDNSGYSTIGGGYSNMLSRGSTFSTIGGGNRNVIQSSVAAIGGGWDNTIGIYGFGAAIAGGESNTNGGDASFIGGGYGNWIQDPADQSVIGGGSANTIVGAALFSVYSTIGGGLFNTILTNGLFSFIGGGATNTVGGTYATVPAERRTPPSARPVLPRAIARRRCMTAHLYGVTLPPRTFPQRLPINFLFAPRAVSVSALPTRKAVCTSIPTIIRPLRASNPPAPPALGAWNL